jgi:hypothetical protein
MELEPDLIDNVNRRYLFYNVGTNDLNNDWYNIEHIHYLDRFLDKDKIKDMKLLDLVGYVHAFPTEENYNVLYHKDILLIDFDEIVGILNYLEPNPDTIEKYLSIFVDIFDQEMVSVIDLNTCHSIGKLVNIFCKYPMVCKYFNSPLLTEKLHWFIMNSTRLFSLSYNMSGFVKVFNEIQDFDESEEKQKIIHYILENSPGVKAFLN